MRRAGGGYVCVCVCRYIGGWAGGCTHLLIHTFNRALAHSPTYSLIHAHARTHTIQIYGLAPTPDHIARRTESKQYSRDRAQRSGRKVCGELEDTQTRTYIHALSCSLAHSLTHSLRYLLSH